MKVSPTPAAVLALAALSLPGCNLHEEEKPHQEHHKIVVTSPQAKNVVITQPYVCQIHSQRHIKVCALESGYLEEIPVREGQVVKKGDVLFTVNSVLYKAKVDAERAEAQLAEIKLRNAETLAGGNLPVVSKQDVLMHRAELAKAQAKVKLAEAELNFATVRAPFDGIVDRLHVQEGTLVKESEVLTTLSDNSVMWVYFNVPEKRYYEYKVQQGKSQEISKLELVDSRIELQLADGVKFNQNANNFVTVEGKFNNETGNISFRADFPNPDYLLRHGQTGCILIHQTLRDAVVIPQRATFEILDKQYVYVVDKDNVVHQREIAIQHEKEDIFVIKKGLDVGDRIVLEGVRQVRDGEKVECEFRKPEEALSNQKYHAE